MIDQTDRYKKYKNYKVDRWIIQGCMLFIFFYLFFVAYHYDFELDYFGCSSIGSSDYLLNLSNNINILPDKPDEANWTFSLQIPNTIDEHYMECKNPFYRPSNWKNQEYLPLGEYGTKPGILFKSAWVVVMGVLLAGFGLNHIIYNRGRKDEGN